MPRVMRGYGNVERKSDDATADRRSGEERTKESSSTGFLTEARGERMKVVAGGGHP